MIPAKFNIGDRVKILPNDGFGIITDIMFSARLKCNLYEVNIEEDDGYGTFVSDDLELAPTVKDYSVDIKIDIAQNVVIATLYEECGDKIRKILRRGHGHIIHDGELGVAQAASYACRRLYESIAGITREGGYCRDH